MIKLKNIILFLLLIISLFAIYLNFDNIKNEFLLEEDENTEVVILPGNNYSNKDEFISFKQVKEYSPNNYNDLLNIYYSVLNQGWDEFTFYCPDTYSSCMNDVKNLSLDTELLGDINNYVHPFNSYNLIRTLYDETGAITIKITHVYSATEISEINRRLEQIIDYTIDDDMDDYEKILAVHDYIIDHTKYDTDKANNNSSLYDSSRIQGVIYDHYAICSGYADTMSAILNMLKIPNFRISSENHVWNAVYLDDQWLHLDLTWDDPVSPSGIDTLSHNYFLIDNEELEELDEGGSEHLFKKDVYLEFNN